MVNVEMTIVKMIGVTGLLAYPPTFVLLVSSLKKYPPEDLEDYLIKYGLCMGAVFSAMLTILSIICIASKVPSSA